MRRGHRLEVKVRRVEIIDASQIIGLVIESMSAVIARGGALSVMVLLLKYSVGLDRRLFH
jgi:hypothetical protein